MAKKIIKAQMKQRIDTKDNWESTNPVLLAGELGIVSDDPNLYKVGDGATAWNALPFRGFDGTIVQESGTGLNTVMSQKAVTKEFTKLKPLSEVLKRSSYYYDFQGTESSIATLLSPITLSKNGDSLEFEVVTEAKDATGAYSFSFCTESGYAIGIASDYISIRDIKGNWLLLTTITPANNNRLIKLEYTNGKINVYIDKSLKHTLDSQSTIRIESFGNGGRGGYGYWKGQIKTLKVNDEPYELFNNAILGEGVQLINTETNTFLSEAEQQALTELSYLAPVAERAKNWSYDYTFQGTESSIATLLSPITLSKDGDALEIEVTTDLKGPNAAYALSAKSTGSHIAIGISADYVAIRDINETWLYLSNTETNNTHTVKIEYLDGKIYIYIDGALKTTVNTQSDIRIDSFGNGAHGTYGYWAGMITSLKVNGKNYDLSSQADLNGVDKTDDDANTLLTQKERQKLNNALPKMLVCKTSDTLQIGYNIPMTSEYIVYNIAHRYKIFEENAYPSFMDNWGLKKPFIATVKNGIFAAVDSIFSDGEAEIAMGVTDSRQPQYGQIVGGAAHGFDVISTTGESRDFLLLVDKKKVDEGAELSMQACQEVTLLQRSKLYQAYSNDNPWADATKLWSFTEQSARLNCSISILRDIKIYNGYMGMFCVYRHLQGDANAAYLTNKVIKNNNPFKVHICEDGWTDQDLQNADSSCTEIILYGDSDYGFALKVTGDNQTKGHGMFVHYNSPTNTYNKVYSQVAANYEAKAGENIQNEVEFVIKKSQKL